MAPSDPILRGRPRWRRRAVRAGRWVALAALVASLALGGYLRTGAVDPALLSPERGGPLVVVDRHGETLRAVASEDGRPGRTGWVTLDEIPALAIAGLVASEDETFFEHSGVSMDGIARALWLNLTTSRRYGGSTLTMQLARMLYSPGAPRTYGRKLMEMRAAFAIERLASKQEILEHYLNRAYYGHGAYGLEAAAQRYFGKPARTLSAAEALTLTVLPRGPAYYDPVRHPERVRARREHIVGLLVDQGQLSGPRAAELSRLDTEVSLHAPPDEAPHFVAWVVSSLPDEVREAGGRVETTLDLELQRSLQRRVNLHIDEHERHGLSAAGAVILDAETAEVLALVGSAEGRAGEAIDMTRWRRYPGSALKPFVYATAIEELGHHPGTVAYDVRDVSATYRAPQTPERGPVSYRFALANSLNFAAVHTLERVGIPRVMSRLRQAGVSPLEQGPDDYGARLALGSTRVTLLDLSAGYRFVVRDGEVRRPTGLTRVLSTRGAEIYRAEQATQQVFSASTAAMIRDILGDGEARRPVFGEELPVDLPFPVAVKTGTAEGFSDTVAVAVTDQVIVGAWVGRLDGAASLGRAGMQSAGPLVRQGLLLAAELHGGRLTLAEHRLPEVELCPLSGLRRGPACPQGVHEPVAEPSSLHTCDWHRDGRVELPRPLVRWSARRR